MLKSNNKSLLFRSLLGLLVVLVITFFYLINNLRSEIFYLKSTNKNYEMLIDNNTQNIQSLLSSLDKNLFSTKYSLLILFNKYGCTPCKERVIKQLQKITPRNNIYLLTASRNTDTVLQKYNNIVIDEEVANRFPDSVILVLVNNNREIILELMEKETIPNSLEEYSKIVNIIFEKVR